MAYQYLAHIAQHLVTSDRVKSWFRQSTRSGIDAPQIAVTLLRISLLALATTAWAQSQTTLKNQPGPCTPGVFCSLAASTGSGKIAFAAVVGPNCQVGQSCGFGVASVGSYFSYQLPDGSSANSSDFSGGLKYLGVNSCGPLCSSYSYALTGTFSGQDSQGRLFTGSTEQGVTINTYSRGGDSAADVGGATTITYSGASAGAATKLQILTILPSSLAVGNSLGPVMVGVEDANGNIVKGSAAGITLALTGPSDFPNVTQTTNAAQGVGSFNEASSLTSPGQYTLLASSSGLTSANAGFSVGGSTGATDYSLSASPASLTLGAGQSGAVNVTVVPTGGFTGTQTFSCGGLPSNAKCSFSPPTLYMDGSGTTASTQMSIAVATGAVAGLHSNEPPRQRGGRGYVMFAALVPVLFVLRKRKVAKAGRSRWMLLFVLAMLMTGMSCSGVSSANSANSTATVVVTAASSNGVARSTSVTLTVVP